MQNKSYVSKLLVPVGLTLIVLVAVTVVGLNWDSFLDWLVPPGNGK